jgi:hypothetical protein
VRRRYQIMHYWGSHREKDASYPIQKGVFSIFIGSRTPIFRRTEFASRARYTQSSQYEHNILCLFWTTSSSDAVALLLPCSFLLRVLDAASLICLVRPTTDCFAPPAPYNRALSESILLLLLLVPPGCRRRVKQR